MIIRENLEYERPAFCPIVWSAVFTSVVVAAEIAAMRN